MDAFKIIVKMNGLLFSPKNDDIFSDFQWENFKRGEPVYNEDLCVDGSDLKFKSFEVIDKRVLLELKPDLAYEVNYFLEKAKCTGVSY